MDNNILSSWEGTPGEPWENTPKKIMRKKRRQKNRACTWNNSQAHGTNRKSTKIPAQLTSYWKTFALKITQCPVQKYNGLSLKPEGWDALRLPVHLYCKLANGDKSFNSLVLFCAKNPGVQTNSKRSCSLATTYQRNPKRGYLHCIILFFITHFKDRIWGKNALRGRNVWCVLNITFYISE